MRKIKFRAWDKDNFNMRHSDKDEESGEGLIIWEIDNNGNPQFLEPQLIDTCPGGEYHEQTIEYRAPNQEIMQYTGLKDKNNTEIYESDIVKIKTVTNEEFYEKGEIIYIPPVFDARVKGTNYLVSSGEELEVIGNKYENPKLLGDNNECS